MANKPSEPGRRKYTKEEDMRIWKYVKDRRTDDAPLAGNTFWKQMEKEKVVPCRTWMSLRDRYLKHIRLKRLYRSKREPADNDNLQHGIKCKIINDDFEEDDRSSTVSTTDGILDPPCSPHTTNNNEDVPCSSNHKTGKLPPSLENGSCCNGSKGQVFQVDNGCKEKGGTETGKDKDVSSTTSQGEGSNDDCSPDLLNKRFVVLVKKGIEERRSHELSKQSRIMDKMRGNDETSCLLSEGSWRQNFIKDEEFGRMFQGQLDLTESQVAVIKIITLMRCKTKATLPQIFFSLFRTNANVENAIAFLNDKDTTNVWTAQEDEILQGKDAEGVENIIKERGHLAVKERLNFIEHMANNP